MPLLLSFSWKWETQWLIDLIDLKQHKKIFDPWSPAVMTTSYLLYSRKIAHVPTGSFERCQHMWHNIIIHAIMIGLKTWAAYQGGLHENFQHWTFATVRYELLMKKRGRGEGRWVGEDHEALFKDKISAMLFTLVIKFIPVAVAWCTWDSCVFNRIVKVTIVSHMDDAMWRFFAMC